MVLKVLPLGERKREQGSIDSAGILDFWQTCCHPRGTIGFPRIHMLLPRQSVSDYLLDLSTWVYQGRQDRGSKFVRKGRRLSLSPRRGCLCWEVEHHLYPDDEFGRDSSTGRYPQVIQGATTQIQIQGIFFSLKKIHFRSSLKTTLPNKRKQHISIEDVRLAF